MKVLVTGASGQLGYDVVKALQEQNIDCRGVSSVEFDITDQSAVERYIHDYSPAAVIHCAAYTAVDKAETEAAKCWQVNAQGTANIAQVCKAIGAKMVYVSTDYVFSGEGDNFYEISEGTNPANVYGMTKLAGEMAVKSFLDKYFIVRISWVFGKNGNNFIKTMLRLGKERPELSIVGDQIGSPTYTVDLAKLLCCMVVSDKYGVYHATNTGVCSWAEFAREVFNQSGLTTAVKQILTREYPTPANRPLNSRLSKRCLQENGFTQLPDWRNAVSRYLEEINTSS